MLKSSEERVRLLKNGVEMKTIEELYIRFNRLKVIKRPILFDFIETPLQGCNNSTDTPMIELKHAGQGTGGDGNSMSSIADAF
ncbi:MAG: hypothetical protein KKG76_03995 [Euryarchaeota archaeon]|nr:hypothetical protein [Euryarchaeota archaeon]